MKNILIVILVTLLAMLMAALSVSCKPARDGVVEHHWDTLLVVRFDTIIVTHTDTLTEKVREVVRDSVVLTVVERITLNEAGDTLAREKETLREGWHLLNQEREKMQHTIDSILRTKLDSVKQSVQHEREEVVVKKPLVWPWMVGAFIIAFLITAIWIALRLVLKK